MTDSHLVAEERIRKRAAERANRITVRRVKAVSVDTVNVVALVDPGDGRLIPMQPVDGTLPAVGDEVTAFKQGDNWWLLSGTLLASGSRTSLGHVPGAFGWGQHANGDFEANNGYFRGTVEAAEFTTSGDDTVARVVITPANDARSVLLYSADPEELLPGALTSFVDGTRQVVRLRGGEFTTGGAGKHASVDVGIDPDTGATFGEAIADDWRVNGLSISRPPYSAKRRVNAQNIASSPHTSPTVALGNAAVVFDTDLKVNWASYITYDGAGTFTITKNGIYPVALQTAWVDGAGGGDGARRYYVNENGTDRIIGNLAAAGNNQVNTIHQVTTDVLVPTDDPFTLQFKVGQYNGFRLALDFTARCSIRRFSAY